MTRMPEPQSSPDSAFESEPGPSRKSVTPTVLTLAVLALLVAVARLHTFHEPLERDITLYAVISHEMLGGRELYSDLWEHKPPAVFLTFAAGELLGGYGPLSIYLLTVTGTIAILIGLYQAARHLGGGEFGGLFAATCWAVLSGDLYLQGNQPNTEIFLNASLVWGLAILAQARDRPLGPWRAALVGALFA